MRGDGELVNELAIAIISGLIAGGCTLSAAIIVRLLDLKARREERQELREREDREVAFKWFDRIYDPLAPFLHASFMLRIITAILTDTSDLTVEQRSRVANDFKGYSKIIEDALDEIVEKGYAAMLPDSIVNDLFGLMNRVDRANEVLKEDPNLEKAAYDDFSKLLDVVDTCNDVRSKLRKMFRVDSIDSFEKRESRIREGEKPELWMLGI